MSEEAKIRKYQNIMIYSGLGIIAFELWAFAKLFLFWLMDKDSLQALFQVPDAELAQYVWVVYITVAVVMLLDLLFRLYIGSNAIRVGRGGRFRMRFLIMTILYILLQIPSTIYTLVLMKGHITLQGMTTALIDVTCSIILLEIVWALWKLRCLKTGGQGQSDSL